MRKTRDLLLFVALVAVVLELSRMGISAIRHHADKPNAHKGMPRFMTGPSLGEILHENGQTWDNNVDDQ